MIRVLVELWCGKYPCKVRINTVALISVVSKWSDDRTNEWVDIVFKPELPEGWTMEPFGPRCPEHKGVKY